MIIKCPRTGMNVQASIPDGVAVEGSDAASDVAFVSFECLACRQLHYVNRDTGEVMGAGRA